MTGAGTLLNVVTVLVGAAVGTLAGDRLPARIRDVVTDALGLVTLLIGGLTALAVRDPALAARVGPSGGVLLVLGSLVIGGIVGAGLRLEDRLEGVGAALHRRLTTRSGTGPADRNADRARFVEGYVTASLVFCVGPLTILGSLSDGLGLGIEQLALKSVLDGFAAVAFAASFGWGVAASALTVLVVQGALTLVGVLAGDVLDASLVAAMSAAGGLLLVGLGLRLLRMRAVPVADLLPALVVAPLLAHVVGVVRT